MNIHHFGYKVKMQMWEFLGIPAIDDQTVRCQVIFSDQALRGGDEIRQEWAGRFQVRKRADFFFRHEDHMERVSRFRMKKGQQGIRFPQALDGEGKRGVVQHKDEDPAEVGPF